MKLSEAIRLGAMLRPQAFGESFRNGGSCAFGAAYEAIGRRSCETPAEDIFPVVARLSACPECGARPGHKAEIISVHLNDQHRWTRERIADWVETIEREHEAAKAHEPGVPKEIEVSA